MSVPDACAAPTIDEKLDSVLIEVAKINRAFPDGPEAHRLAHEAMMKAAVAEEKFWNELKLDIAKKGIWGLMVIVIGLAVIGLAAKFGLAVGVK